MQNTYPKLYSFLCQLKRTVNRLNKEKGVFSKNLSYYDALCLCAKFENDEINDIMDYIFDDLINFICENLIIKLNNINLSIGTDIRYFFLSELRGRFYFNTEKELSRLFTIRFGKESIIRILYYPINYLLTWANTKLGVDFYSSFDNEIHQKIVNLYKNI